MTWKYWSILLVVSLLNLVTGQFSGDTLIVQHAGCQFIDIVTKQYGVDITKIGYETVFASHLRENQKNIIEFQFTGEFRDSPKVFEELRSIIKFRYLDIIAAFDIDENLDSEANIWFYLAGHASKSVSPQLIDDEIQSLLSLAHSAIHGQPFYPKQIVISLIDSVVTKFDSKLATLIRQLGQAVLAKAQAFAMQSLSPPVDGTAVNIPAEFFQFWQHLCQFTEKYIQSDSLQQPLVLMETANIKATLLNLQPPGAPFSRSQFQTLMDFIEAKIQSNEIDVSMLMLAEGSQSDSGAEELPVLRKPKTVGKASPGNKKTSAQLDIPACKRYTAQQQKAQRQRNIQQLQAQALVDATSFYRGYCAVTDLHDIQVLTGYVSNKHSNYHIKLQEFSFLIRTFRQVRQSVAAHFRLLHQHRPSQKINDNDNDNDNGGEDQQKLQQPSRQSENDWLQLCEQFSSAVPSVSASFQPGGLNTSSNNDNDNDINNEAESEDEAGVGLDGSNDGEVRHHRNVRSTSKSNNNNNDNDSGMPSNSDDYSDEEEDNGYGDEEVVGDLEDDAQYGVSDSYSEE